VNVRGGDGGGVFIPKRGKVLARGKGGGVVKELEGSLTQGRLGESGKKTTTTQQHTHSNKMATASQKTDVRRGRGEDYERKRGFVNRVQRGGKSGMIYQDEVARGWGGWIKDLSSNGERKRECGVVPFGGKQRGAG